MFENNIAWVDHGSTRYIVRGPNSEFALESSVLRLINGVYETCKLDSFRVLRNRIFTKFEPGAVDRSTVKLVAKRIQRASFDMELKLIADQIDLSHIAIEQRGAERAVELLGNLFPEHQAIELCRSILLQMTLKAIRYESPRQVSAVLIGPDGRLLGAAVNSNELNRFRHAEVNLVSNFFVKSGTLIPAGSLVVTSLSPCRMCGQILASMSAEGVFLRVIALQRDTGRYGSSSDLKNQLILA